MTEGVYTLHPLSDVPRERQTTHTHFKNKQSSLPCMTILPTLTCSVGTSKNELALRVPNDPCGQWGGGYLASCTPPLAAGACGSLHRKFPVEDRQKNILHG